VTEPLGLALRRFKGADDTKIFCAVNNDLDRSVL